MEVSIQTERYKKNLSSQNSNLHTKQVSQQKNRQKSIKQLTQINKDLIRVLKSQNEDLSKKINSEHKKSHNRSISVQNNSPNKQEKKIKKQLVNVYKQIQMYKTMIINMKAKQISTESSQKIKDMQNRLIYEDKQIQNLQKQLNNLTNIRDQQKKQMELYENNDTKKLVGDLEKQIKDLKQKLKSTKNQYEKRQQMEKKQHLYSMQLQKQLRKMNGQFYPGKQLSMPHEKNGKYDEIEITERQWQKVKQQFQILQQEHENFNKKIEGINRKKQKQYRAYQENQLRIKEKISKLDTLKRKMEEVTKLVNYNSNKEQKQLSSMFMKKLKVQKQEQRNPENFNRQKQIKQIRKWEQSRVYYKESGKKLPNSIYFTDKQIIQAEKQIKIVKVNIWVDESETPCILQLFYTDKRHKIIQGNQPISFDILSSYKQHTWELQEGDYLLKMLGYFSFGLLTGLTLVSKQGRSIIFNNASSGDAFEFISESNQVISCIFGAYEQESDSQIRICYLGCQFTSLQ